MKEKEFMPDESETLLAAFKVNFNIFFPLKKINVKLLDTDNKGFIEIEMMRTFLTKEGSVYLIKIFKKCLIFN